MFMRRNKLKAEIIAFVSDWHTKRVFKNCVVFLNIRMKTGESLNSNYFGLSQCRFFMQLVTLWLYPTFVSAEVFRTAVNSKRKKSNTIE